MKKKQTVYDKVNKLVVTELSGELDINDIEEWHQSLRTVLDTLEPATNFKILVNLFGFTALNFDAHKKFRTIIPELLAAYGWYVGYLRMFPEASVFIRSSANIRCIAAAHVHQDETKIRNYADNYSMRNESFFTDAAKAREWIESIPIPEATFLKN
ncbi:MAG: hypothetical protein EOO01_21290 [Chitinophagaceae bacterium]|nr:MAG: hypothetical protein EOO01_21290 [Chitinophagaceae bacterium]